LDPPNRASIKNVQSVGWLPRALLKLEESCCGALRPRTNCGLMFHQFVPSRNPGRRAPKQRFTNVASLNVPDILSAKTSHCQNNVSGPSDDSDRALEPRAPGAGQTFHINRSGPAKVPPRRRIWSNPDLRVRGGSLDGYKIHICLRFGAPRTPSEPPSPDPESPPKGRERGLPAIPNNSWIGAKSKKD
jgi:hypothetical protein